MVTLREHLEAILDDGAECSGMKRAKQHAQAALDIIDTGEVMRRIGRAFYDDTDEGQPVLVIPLDAP